MLSPAAYQVGPDTVVHFSYELFDEEGELVESSGDSELSFLCGYGQLAPGMEAALLGLEPGDRKRIVLPPGEAFGKRDPDAIIEVDRGEFPEELDPGDEFQADTDDGGCVTLMVVDVDAERVVLDTNHPLAGQTIAIDVLVRAVRPALSQELEEAVELLESSGPGSSSLLPATGLLRRPSAVGVAVTEEFAERAGRRH